MGEESQKANLPGTRTPYYQLCGNSLVVDMLSSYEFQRSFHRVPSPQKTIISLCCTTGRPHSSTSFREAVVWHSAVLRWVSAIHCIFSGTNVSISTLVETRERVRPSVQGYLALNLRLSFPWNHLIIRTCLTIIESTTVFCRFYDICFLCVLASYATLFPR